MLEMFGTIAAAIVLFHLVLVLVLAAATGLILRIFFAQRSAGGARGHGRRGFRCRSYRLVLPVHCVWMRPVVVHREAQEGEAGEADELRVDSLSPPVCRRVLQQLPWTLRDPVVDHAVLHDHSFLHG